MFADTVMFEGCSIQSIHNMLVCLSEKMLQKKNFRLCRVKCRIFHSQLSVSVVISFDMCVVSCEDFLGYENIIKASDII